MVPCFLHVKGLDQLLLSVMVPSRLPAGGRCEVRGRILSIIHSVTMLIRKLMQRLLLPKMLMLKMLKPKMQISPMLMPMFLM